MYYSSIGILALMIHVIINFNVLITPGRSLTVPAHRTYRNFLFSVMTFYITDVLWGILYSMKLLDIAFAETALYFIIMTLSVFLWTQYVTDYLNVKKKFITVLKFSGFFFFICQTFVLIFNFFYPIAFWFSIDGSYHTGKARRLIMLFQLLIFMVTTVYMFYFTLQSQDKIKKRYCSICLFGFVMTVFVILQELYPLMPFYSIGYMVGTCLIHTFVLEDEKAARQAELEMLLKVEEIQEQELGSARHMAFTDPLTGVKNKNAYIEDVGGIEKRIEDGILKDFGIIVFDVNGLKNINDTKGHDEGDKFIKKASKLICRQFRHSPIYRIGGDEFVAFLMRDDYKNHEKLLEEFNRQIEKNQAEGSVVIASGFADFQPEKFATFLRLFEHADKMMYERKKVLKGII